MIALFTFYALPSGGKSKDAVVHCVTFYFLLPPSFLHSFRLCLHFCFAPMRCPPPFSSPQVPLQIIKFYFQQFPADCLILPLRMLMSRFLKIKNGPFPLPLFRLFLPFQTNINTIFKTKLCEEMSIQYTVLGFEPTPFRTRVSSHNH